MPRRKSARRRSYSSRSSLGATLRRPTVQIGILVVVTLLVFLIASLGGEQANNASELPAFVSVGEAYQMYEEGTFVLDVRTPEEWNEFHAPDTTLIPLDELSARVNELPKDQPIVVICRSGNRSAQAASQMEDAGLKDIADAGGLADLAAAGVPVE